jgi:hypothetical protein
MVVTERSIRALRDALLWFLCVLKGSVLNSSCSYNWSNGYSILAYLQRLRIPLTTFLTFELPIRSALLAIRPRAQTVFLSSTTQVILMNSTPNNPLPNTQWESVHICPRCEHILSLEEMDLRTITTGIVECPKCQWAGPIEIQVTDLHRRP